MYRRGRVDCRRSRLGRWIDGLCLYASTFSQGGQKRIASTLHQLHAIRRHDGEFDPVEFLFERMKHVVIDRAFAPE